MKNGLRYTTIGAGLGLCTGIFIGVYNLRKHKRSSEASSDAAENDEADTSSRSEGNNEARNEAEAEARRFEKARKFDTATYPYVEGDEELRSIVTELLQYRKIAPKQCVEVLSNADSLLKVAQSVNTEAKVSLVWPSVAQRHTTKIVDALRLMRLKIGARNPQLLVEVDEWLKRAQKRVSDINFNVIMGTNSRLEA